MKTKTTTRARRNALAFSTAMFAATASFAQEVNLRSADGAVNLNGELLEFSDDSYLIRTPLGELRVAAETVTCTGDGCPAPVEFVADVVLSGSDTIAEGVLPLLLSGYSASLGADEVVTLNDVSGELRAELVGEEGFGDPIGSYLVRSSISSDAFMNLLSKSAKIGMSSRPIRAEEAELLGANGAGDMTDPAQEHILAVDSLLVVTHQNNPVNTLSTEQLRGIFSGQITNWSEVGGNDANIMVVNIREGSGTRSTFESRLYNGSAAGGTPPFQSRAQGNTDAAALVNENENAIGYVSFAFKRGTKPLTLFNECGLEMVPDAFSARTEEYALQRFLYLYSRADTRDRATTDFVEFATSQAADQVIAKSGFVDLGVSRKEQVLDSQRARQLLDPNAPQTEGNLMRDMLSQMTQFDRLSSTFRFRTGSSTLDARGLLNLKRLASYLEEQPEGSRVVFAGFTDEVGSFSNNRALAVGRAEQVLQQMRSTAPEVMGRMQTSILGYGEIAPVGCNETEAGRANNRRVEVWIEKADG